MDTTEYMTTPEVAEMLRVSPETVRLWRRNGRGPRFVKAGRRVLYARVAIQEWMAGHPPRVAIPIVAGREVDGQLYALAAESFSRASDGHFAGAVLIAVHKDGVWASIDLVRDGLYLAEFEGKVAALPENRTTSDGTAIQVYPGAPESPR